MRAIRLRAGFVVVALVLLLAAAAGLALGARSSPAVDASTAAVNGAADSAATVSGGDFEAALAAAGFSIDGLDPQPQPATRFGRGFGFGGGFGMWGFAGNIVHVEGVLNTRAKGLVTFALDHGKAAAVSDTSLTVSEATGGSVTVALNGDTKIRLRGTPNAKGSAIPKDAEVYVLSQKVGSGWLASHVIVLQPIVKSQASPKPAAPTAPTTSPTSPAAPESPTEPVTTPTPTPSPTASPTEEATPSATPSGGGANG